MERSVRQILTRNILEHIFICMGGLPIIHTLNIQISIEIKHLSVWREFDFLVDDRNKTNLDNGCQLHVFGAGAPCDTIIDTVWSYDTA
jgi:hypothetical protein